MSLSSICSGVLALVVLTLAGAPWWALAAFGVFILGPYPVLWALRKVDR
jgi:hypothetical protein